MKAYKLKHGILLEKEEKFYQLSDVDWDSFINSDDVLSNALALVENATPVENASALLTAELDAPMSKQELWACGVTYYKSKQGRQEESKDSGGADFYQRVYDADRPEVFFKATRNRVVGHSGEVRIRKDSEWDVPEPELVLALNSQGKIIGFTIGNDMSSRSIEGENPLYLPQAKTYDGCAAVGPCILLSNDILPSDTEIALSIERGGEEVFAGSVEISSIKRSFDELTHYLFRECSFEHGALLMTGTGIVPGSDFTLQAGDQITISIDSIGVLSNRVA